MPRNALPDSAPGTFIPTSPNALSVARIVGDMRQLLVVLAMSTVAACASSSKFRDVNGMPVPTYAVADSTFRPIDLRCGSEQFFVVDDPQNGNGGRHLKAVPQWLWSLDADRLCARIYAYDH
jgi:hypothetical protein